MILIVNTCAQKLHYFEFVKPIEDILRNTQINYFSKHYSELTEDDFEKAEKIIISGTSLQDNQFLEGDFSWIKKIKKPILGICAGMQIIGLTFGGELKSNIEIGFYKEEFNNFLGLNGKEEVYHLHHNHVNFNEDFEIFSESNIPEAVQYKNIFGVLFHPEVRQKELILNFVQN